MSNGRLFGSSLASLLFGTACLLPACAVEAPDDPEEIGSAQSALAASPPTRVERCKNDCYYAWHVCINACKPGIGATKCIEGCNTKQTACEAKCKPNKSGNFMP